jgi:putative flavoprotein involved in K+ transport
VLSRAAVTVRFVTRRKATVVTGTDKHVDTIVIGGSQAGLAVGYHLAQRGCRFVILDAHERVGDAWRRRWDSLRLFTTARYDGLPGMPFPAPMQTYPTKDEVADYLVAYAEHFSLPVETGVTVDRLARDGQRFIITAGDRSHTADNVVVASGAYHTPRVPDFADGLDPAIRQLHSSDYRNPGQLTDGEVLVVGAGNSGAEIAIEVAKSHRTWLSGRDPGQEPTRAGSLPDRLLMPFMWFMASRVLTIDSPIGRRMRDHFLDPPRGIPLGRARRSDIRAAGIDRVPRTTAVHDGRPQLDDGRTLDVSNVIWCTGFKMELSWMDLPVIGDHGFPRQEYGVAASEPGLYFMGLPFQRSLSSALLGGVGRDAEFIADQIAARATTPPPVMAT